MMYAQKPGAVHSTNYFICTLSTLFPTVLGILAKEAHDGNILEYGLRMVSVSAQTLSLLPIPGPVAGTSSGCKPPPSSPQDGWPVACLVRWSSLTWLMSH